MKRAASMIWLALTVTPLAAQHERSWIPRPFFELRLENADVFTETRYAPLFAGLVDALAGRFGIEGEGRRGKLEGMWDNLDWPVEVVVMLDRRTELPVGGVFTPSSSATLMADLLTLSQPDEVVHSKFFLEDAAFASAEMSAADDSLHLSVTEGVLADRRLLFLGHPDSVGELETSIPQFLRIAERETPSRVLLAEHATGGDIGWVFHVRSLLSAVKGEDWRWAQALIKVAIGPRFTGVAGRMRATAGDLEIDLYADIRPGKGWVGNLLWRQPRDLAAAGWVPPDASDWVAFDLSVDSVIRTLHQLSIFNGGPGVDIFSELDWLSGVNLEEFLDTHFTGQAFAATEVGIETQFDDIEDLDGTVVGLGSFDGHALLREMQNLVNGRAADLGDEETWLRETPALGPGVHTLKWEGEERLILAAQRDMIFFCSTGPASAAMLRKVLATGGRGTEVSPEDRVCTMIGRGHVLEHLTKAMNVAEEVGAFAADAERRDELPKLLESFLASHGGVAWWRVVADGDGTRLRVKL